ncbi:TetR/AcrR family transcriptional regulator [Caproicibacter sp.]|uniref:TetR/AcrR family transcriptional regulator n=1 Tax=Caproicibacter sp. TaxID=2814884 RepID=UPI0039894A5F
MRLREQQRISREKQIRDCSLDLFISQGYVSTGIRDIAQKLQIATGVFFNYYESKEKIYFELIKEAVEGQKYIEQMLLQTENPIDTLQKVTETALSVFEKNDRSLKLFVLIMQAFWSAATPDSVKELLNNYDLITPTATLISIGQKVGQTRQGDPLALSNAYWSAIQGIALNKSLLQELPFPKSDWIVAILKP